MNTLKNKKTDEEIFEYVSRNQYKYELQISRLIISKLRTNLKTNKNELITFQENYIGSKKTNLILKLNSNDIFDFDINLNIGSKTKITDWKIIYNKIINSIPIKIEFENKKYEIVLDDKESKIINLSIKDKDIIVFTIDLALTKIDNKNNIWIYTNNLFEKRNEKLEKVNAKIKIIKNESNWNKLRDEYKKLKTEYYNSTFLSSYIIFIQAVNNILNNSTSK